tara:strand:- start:456 stop:1448 length:993 start_codon:yes stop_codon:yes gene_type:complete
MKNTSSLICLLLIWVTGMAQGDITQVEYFLDADNGVGLNTILDVDTGADISASIVADIPAGTSLGYHKLYFRMKDENNQWSQTTRKNIQIVQPESDNVVSMGEYFIDNDPTHTYAINFEISPEIDDITQAFTAQIVEGTPIGYHKLYGRVRDRNGSWSQTFRKNIQVVDAENNPEIAAIEYFFDEDLTYGATNVMNLDNPAEDGSWTLNVPYTAGDYDFEDVLYVRVLDSNGKWSQTTILDLIEELGLERVTNNLFHVYPNPVIDLVNINKIDDLITIQEINVYDIMGKKVFTSLTQENNKYSLSILTAGIYILNIKTEKGGATYNIIKK